MSNDKMRSEFDKNYTIPPTRDGDLYLSVPVTVDFKLFQKGWQAALSSQASQEDTLHGMLEANYEGCLDSNQEQHKIIKELKLRVAELEVDLSELTLDLGMEKKFGTRVLAERNRLQSECNRLKEQEKNFQKSIIGNRRFVS